MPKLTLHPLSVLAGAAIVGLVLLTSSQALTPVGGYRIEYLPHPRDMVQIRGDVPYVVPAGKVLVVTGLGGQSQAVGGFIRVDGEDVVGLTAGSGAEPRTSVMQITNGLTIQAGATVELLSTAHAPEGYMRAWGYLASQ